MSVLAIIPARGQSKRLPNKNKRLLGGIPLIEYTIKAGLDAVMVDNIVVTTDDSEIALISQSLGVQVQYPRPAKLSEDDSPIEDVIKHSILLFETNGSHPDIIVLLQPTSPFRTAKHIDDAINLLITSQADTVTAVRRVVEHPYYMWKQNNDEIIPYYSIEKQFTSRNNLPSFYIENGSIYVIKKNIFIQYGLYGNRVMPYEMSQIESIDIDEAIDLDWTEFLMLKQKSKDK